MVAAEEEVEQARKGEEATRLDALRLHDLTPGEDEPAFHDLANLAAVVLDAPIAFFSIVERDRVRYKARVGSATTEHLREGSFCSVTIANDDLLVVTDANLDPRFCDHPMVTGEPHVRFYAGAPVRTVEGHKIGTLCVLDTRPREIGERERDALRALARQAAAQLALRRQALEMHSQRALLDLARIDLSRRDEALRRIVETSSSALGVERVGVWFFDDSRSAIVVEDLYTASSAVHTEGERLTAADYPTYFAALAESRTIAADDAANDARTREFYPHYLALHDVRSMLDVPVRSEGNVVGIVCYEHTASLRSWTPREQLYAASTADLVGTVVEASRRRRTEEELRELTATLELRVHERTADLEQSNHELALALHDLEAFSYSISHDLRAPLRVINGFASILEDAAQSQGEVLRDAVSRIRANTVRMSELIDDMLAFFRLGRRRLAIGVVDMNALVRDVVEMLGLDVAHAGVRFGELLPAEGDKALLGDVLANLLGNAVKFSARSRDPRVEVGSESGPREVVYFVRDNGIGFDAKNAPRLFEPFQRLHAADGYEGAGIGLATVQRIVNRHGGRVWAESAPGHGATFRFSLPSRANSTPSPGN